MSDRLPSDHPAVDSHRVELGTVGATSQPELLLPPDLTCETGDFVRLVLDGTATHAEVVATMDGKRALRGAHENRRLARSERGPGLLADWLEEYDPGTTLVLDVLTEGYAYGLREPGERVVYDPVEQPRSSLRDIAEGLDE
jgi:hypothetical protein